MARTLGFPFWLFAWLTAGLTAFYMFRLYFKTFRGECRADEKVKAHIHESPNVMLWPLRVLAIGAVIAGSLFYGGFVGSAHEEGHEYAVNVGHMDEYVNTWDRVHFWGDSLFVLPENDTVEAAHHVPIWVKKLPIVAGILGIALAYLMYMFREGLAGLFVKMFKPIHLLFYRKWFFDEIYHFLIVKNAIRLGTVFSIVGDRKIIDRFGPNGIAYLSQRIAGRLSVLQTGYLYHYALVMIIGLIILLSWFTFKSGLGG